MAIPTITEAGHHYFFNASTLTSIKKNDVVKARVVDVSNNNVLINIKGNIVKAQSVVPLQKGDTLYLHVGGSEEEVILKLVENQTQNQITSPLLSHQVLNKTHLPVSISQIHTLLKTLPQSIIEKFPVLKNLQSFFPKMEDLSPEILKEKIETSGLFLEMHLKQMKQTGNTSQTPSFLPQTQEATLVLGDILLGQISQEILKGEKGEREEMFQLLKTFTAKSDKSIIKHPDFMKFVMFLTGKESHEITKEDKNTIIKLIRTFEITPFEEKNQEGKNPLKNDIGEQTNGKNKEAIQYTKKESTNNSQEKLLPSHIRGKYQEITRNKILLATKTSLQEESSRKNEQNQKTSSHQKENIPLFKQPHVKTIIHTKLETLDFTDQGEKQQKGDSRKNKLKATSREENSKTNMEEKSQEKYKENNKEKSLSQKHISPKRENTFLIKNDLKAILLNAKKAMYNMEKLFESSEEKSIKKTINTLLENIEFKQFQSHAEGTLHTYFPFLWDALENGELIFKKNNNEQNRGKNCSCIIHLQLKNWGGISVNIFYHKNTFHIHITAENEQITSTFQRTKAILKKQLLASGLQVDTITIKNEKVISKQDKHITGLDIQT